MVQQTVPGAARAKTFDIEALAYDGKGLMAVLQWLEAARYAIHEVEAMRAMLPQVREAFDAREISFPDYDSVVSAGAQTIARIVEHRFHQLAAAIQSGNVSPPTAFAAAHSLEGAGHV